MEVVTCTAALFCRRQELIHDTPHTNQHKTPRQWAYHSREPGTGKTQNRITNGIRKYGADNDITTANEH